MACLEQVVRVEVLQKLSLMAVAQGHVIPMIFKTKFPRFSIFDHKTRKNYIKTVSIFLGLPAAAASLPKQSD